MNLIGLSSGGMGRIEANEAQKTVFRFDLREFGLH